MSKLGKAGSLISFGTTIRCCVCRPSLICALKRTAACFQVATSNAGLDYHNMTQDIKAMILTRFLRRKMMDTIHRHATSDRIAFRPNPDMI